MVTFPSTSLTPGGRNGTSNTNPSPSPFPSYSAKASATLSNTNTATVDVDNDVDYEVDDGVDDNDFTFEEMDECSMFPGQLCSHICIDTRYGFECACPEGFVLDPHENTSCIADVDQRNEKEKVEEVEEVDAFGGSDVYTEYTPEQETATSRATESTTFEPSTQRRGRISH